MPVLLYGAEAWTLISSDEQGLGVFKRKILRKIYGPFCDKGEWRIRSNQELYDIYDDIEVMFAWIFPTQFVKFSNLCQVVEVADKNGLASIGLNRWMRM